MKNFDIQKFTSHEECLLYLRKYPKRHKGIYIEANDALIRPGIGILLARIKRHSLRERKEYAKIKRIYEKIYFSYSINGLF